MKRHVCAETNLIFLKSEPPLKMFVTGHSLSHWRCLFLFSLISFKIKFIELSLYNKKLRLMVFSVTLFTHSVTWHWSFVHTILWNTKYMFFTRKAYFLSCLFILLFVYYLSDSLCNLLVFEISFLYFQLLRPMGSLSLFVQFILIQL